MTSWRDLIARLTGGPASSGIKGYQFHALLDAQLRAGAEARANELRRRLMELEAEIAADAHHRETPS